MKGTLTTIIAIILVLIVGYWLFNTPKGSALRQDINAGSQAAVYRVNEYDPRYDYPSRNTLVPVDGRSSAYGPKEYPRQTTGQVAYVTYPIDRASSSSGHSSTYYAPASTGTSSSSSSSYSSYYYTNPSYNYYPAPSPQGGCYVSGCSNQICSSQPNAVSTCEYREDYACYQTARCERQASGQCGWTMTDELYSCLLSR
jgi:hypothetical protein